MEAHDLIFVVTALVFGAVGGLAFLAERQRTKWRRRDESRTKAFRRELEDGAHRA